MFLSLSKTELNSLVKCCRRTDNPKHHRTQRHRRRISAKTAAKILLETIDSVNASLKIKPDCSSSSPVGVSCDENIECDADVESDGSSDTHGDSDGGSDTHGDSDDGSDTHGDSDGGSSSSTVSCKESECDGDNQNLDIEDLKNGLITIKIGSNMPNSHMNRFLALLRRWHPDLPKDSRTLVPPPSHLHLRPLGEGHYYHFGIAESIRYVAMKLHPKHKLLDGEVLNLQVNFDGLPIDRSNPSHLWPILASLKSVCRHPFLIGVYFSRRTKPTDVGDYLSDFIEEYNALKLTGVFIRGKMYAVRLSTIVCDAPAKAFIKCCKGHGGYGGCDKCTDAGKYVNHRVIFPNVDAPKRTDESFRLQTDLEHHNVQGLNRSPFLSAGIGKYSNVLINDLMLSANQLF